VQIGRTVINFSVKAITSGSSSGTGQGLSKDEYFGPRPGQSLIKGKMDEVDQIMTQAAINKSSKGAHDFDSAGEDMPEGHRAEDEDMQMDNVNDQHLFQVAASGILQNAGSVEDIPNELLQQ
jgi:hypothetical protein